MAELFKKQIITEEMYLEENGTIQVIYHPEKKMSDWYSAYALSLRENTSGPTYESAIKKMLSVLMVRAAEKERTINSQKNIFKESVKTLKEIKACIEEAKRFLGE